MTTIESMQETKKLINRFVQGEISDGQFYSMLHALSHTNREELNEFVVQLRHLAEEVEEARKKR